MQDKNSYSGHCECTRFPCLIFRRYHTFRGRWFIKTFRAPEMDQLALPLHNTAAYKVHRELIVNADLRCLDAQNRSDIGLDTSVFRNIKSEQRTNK